jgi:DNA gyrase/topoisomerase IV subunit B
MSQQKLQFLSEIEHIQMRPGMYVGDVSTPRTLVRELVDNALDEYLNGHASKIAIEYDPARGIYTIKDNGRGLPLYPVKEFDGQTAAKLLFLKLFSGGKFTHDNYKWSSGLHGVGLTAVNALSERVEVRVNKEKSHYFLVLENGQVIEERRVNSSLGWSTVVTAQPNRKIFKTHKTVIDTLPLSLAKDMNPKGSITINGREVERFSFVKTIGDKLLKDHTFHVKGIFDTVIFDLYFAWTEKEYSYVNKGTVNLVPCTTGWHERVAKRCIGKALAQCSELIQQDDASYGLRAFVNLFTQEPHFTSQSKDRLSHIGDEPKDFEDELVKVILKKLRAEEDATQVIIQKIVAYKKQMEKLSDKEFINSVIKKGDDKRRSFGMGTGVWDCTTTERSKAELYIVEGEAAAGHIRRTKNQQYQAVLPLQGKPVNAAAADDIKVILSAKSREQGESELVSMVNCIGAGITPDVDISAMRYGKILITADADADGAQIANLIIGALIYLVPEVVEKGYVYEVLPPLYEQNGQYFYRLAEINQKKSYHRFKGLGSMNPNDVHETIVNPKTRRLRQVTLDSRQDCLEILQTAREKKRIMLQGGVIRE